MSGPIDDENPSAYFGRVAEELERIARVVTARPGLDRALSRRLLEFAERIRRDSAIPCEPPRIPGFLPPD